MSLFENKNFITQILKSQGCEQFSDEVALSIQILVQLETRKLIQTAGKFMRHDHRDSIEISDIHQSLTYMGHKDIAICNSSLEEQYKKDNAHSQYIRIDPIFTDPTAFFNQELKSINTTFSFPKFRGRWIYINGKIPKNNENHQLRSLSDMRSLKLREEEEKKKKFNVIRDQPLSMLTKQQLQYYKMITEVLISPNQPTNPTLLQPNGNVAALLPFFIKFFMNTNINDRTIIFMLNLLDNKYVKRVLLPNLHQILIYLMSYCGEQSFRVGTKIGELACQFSQKHPVFYDLFETDEEQTNLNICQPSQLVIIYSTMLKKIAFQLYTGVAIKISMKFIKKCMQDATTAMEVENVIKSTLNQYISVKKMASLCLNRLVQFWGQISALREIHLQETVSSKKKNFEGQQKSFVDFIGQIYWSPNLSIRQQSDPYLLMNL